MIIKSLELENFRNYDSLSLNFDSKTNILYGDNAQGKTNVLEAIYLSSTTKSHKGSKDNDIINLIKYINYFFKIWLWYNHKFSNIYHLLTPGNIRELKLNNNLKKTINVNKSNT